MDILEFKNIITEMENLVASFMTRLDTAKERRNELGDNSQESIQIEAQKENILEKIEKRVRGIQ